MDLEQTLVNIVREAGQKIKEKALDFNHMEWKKLDDPVTILDQNTEQFIKQEMKFRYGNANFIGEEFGTQDNKAKYTLIIDPIDGTKSFIRREFYCSTSVGIEENGKLIGGIVNDFMKDIIYVAFRDNAYIWYQNGKLPMYKKCELSKPNICLDKEYYTRVPQIEDDKRFFTKEQRGSFALTLAHLASGTYDAAIFTKDNKGKIWDVAGGYYIAKQQGYYIKDNKGKKFDYKNPNKGFVAIKPDLVEIIRPLIERKKYIKYEIVQAKDHHDWEDHLDG